MTYPRFVSVVSVLAIFMAFIAYIATPRVLKYYRDYNDKAIKQRWVEFTEYSIKRAHETGELVLWPDTFFCAKDFYANKLFYMVRGHADIRSLTCNGYPRVLLPIQSVECISTMPDLEEIYFRCVWFNTGALRGLNNLPGLVTLSFQSCLLDNDSMNHIAELKQVRSLTITCPEPNLAPPGGGCEIALDQKQQILESLCMMKHLHSLTIQECFSTEIEILKKYLPETNIVFENEHCPVSSD